MMKKQLVFLSLIVGLLGCGDRGDKLTQLPSAETAGTQAAPVAVTTTVVTRENVAHPVLATGTTEPVQAANVGPQMTARVTAVLVDEGDVVKAGQPLVRLDVVSGELRQQQSAAQVAQTQTQYELAKSEYDRLAPLVERGTITQQQLQRLASQRDALKAAADAAKVANADAAHSVTNSIVRAPFGGVVSAVKVEVGEIATMTPVQVLVRIVDLSSVEVRFSVHERELGRFRVGSKVSAHFTSANEKSEGEVRFISPEISAATRSAEVVARFPNKDGKLRAGMFTELSIAPEQAAPSLVIPSTAVGGTGSTRYAFVVSDGVAKRRSVRVSAVDSNRIEVLEGLSVGDVIVRDGVGKLSDGAKVSLVELGAPDKKEETAERAQ
jgi:membrane fusion protein (multidrug efflux system)